MQALRAVPTSSFLKDFFCQPGGRLTNKVSNRHGPTRTRMILSEVLLTSSRVLMQAIK